MNNSKIVVGLYIRVSTQEQASEGYSIGEQKTRLEKYADAHDWKVFKIYSDPGFSGGSLDRPGLTDLIRDVQRKKIDKVVVYKLDRLSRSQKDTLYLIEDVFLKNDVDFVSMTENFDTGTPLGIAMVGILSVFAQLERAQIKERMTLGREARAKKGYYYGGNHKLIGYRYRGGLLEVDEYESMLVKQIFDLYLSGKSQEAIAKYMNAKGLTHHNGEWLGSSIGKILVNRTYIGEVKFSGVWYDGLQDPIIDTDKFERAQRIRKDVKKLNSWDKSISSLLGGLIYCKKCGARYSKLKWKPKQDGSRTEVYSCYNRSGVNKSMRTGDKCDNKNYIVKDLDDLILGEIRKLALDPDYLKEVESNNAKAGSSDKIAILQKEIDDISKKISKYMDMYALDLIPIEDINAKIKPLAERREKLEYEIEDIDEDLDTNYISAEDRDKVLNSFEAVLDSGDFKTLRTVITTLINRIDIDGDDLYISWKFR